jgi:carboxyl-terminal processing protease
VPGSVSDSWFWEKCMSRFAKIAIISLSLLVFSYVSLGYVLGKTDDEKTYRSLTVYGEVMQRIQEDYVDQPDLSLVTAGSLHGLLESLDPFSGYFSAREYADYKDKQKRQVHGEDGATLAKRFGSIVVVSELTDGPAAKAGLRDGDILEAIAGFTTREMSVGQANLLLEGNTGTTVKVAVVRRGKAEPQTIDLPRAVIGVPQVTVTKIDDAAYIHIPELDAGVAAELRDKLQQLDKQGLRKLVLDLRDCARGPASEGVAVAQLFVPSGNITVLKGQTVSKQEFNAAPDKVVWRNSVEVLISESTSGAAEIIAAAMGDSHRGDLVGGRTFGGASEQKIIPLDDGGALLLTVAYYYTPKGKSIMDDGVQPTVAVAADLTADNNIPLTDDADAAPPPLPQWPSLEDPVLRKALDLLKTDLHKAA